MVEQTVVLVARIAASEPAEDVDMLAAAEVAEDSTAGVVPAPAIADKVEHRQAGVAAAAEDM